MYNFLWLGDEPISPSSWLGNRKGKEASCVTGTGKNEGERVVPTRDDTARSLPEEEEVQP